MNTTQNNNNNNNNNNINRKKRIDATIDPNKYKDIFGSIFVLAKRYTDLS